MPNALLTLAYEGGHPDHDSCSFLAAQLAKRCNVPCWEAPLYHRSPDGGGAYQEFIAAPTEEIDVNPTSAEQEAKRQMCRAYVSQGDFLTHFRVDKEYVRPQPAYNFTEPPHPGKTNYEVWQWKMSSQEVCCAFGEFLRQQEKSGKS